MCDKKKSLLGIIDSTLVGLKALGDELTEAASKVAEHYTFTPDELKQATTAYKKCRTGGKDHDTCSATVGQSMDVPTISVSFYMTRDKIRLPFDQQTARDVDAMISKHRIDFKDTLQDALGHAKDTAQDTVTDWVRDKDNEENYEAFVSAIITGAAGVLGAVFPPTGVAIAVGTGVLGVIQSVPKSDDPQGAFRDKMRQAYNSAYEDAYNRIDDILDAWQKTLTTVPKNVDEAKKDLIKQVYPKAANGFTVSSQTISKRVTKQLNKAWKKAEAARKKAEEQKKINDIKRHHDFIMSHPGAEFCWVAREVVPDSWTDVRHYILGESPDWFRELYGEQGPAAATVLRRNPQQREELRPAFELLARRGRGEDVEVSLATLNQLARHLRDQA